jgi:hypothetical protein
LSSNLNTKRNVGTKIRVQWLVKKTTAAKSMIYFPSFLCASVTTKYMQKQGLTGQGEKDCQLGEKDCQIREKN